MEKQSQTKKLFTLLGITLILGFFLIGLVNAVDTIDLMRDVWKDIIDLSKFKDLIPNVLNFGLLFFQYIARQPLSLVSLEGVG